MDNLRITAKEYLIKHARKPQELGIFEFGVSSLRFDAILIDCYRPNVRIFEFKDSRADFRSDKKWEKYLRYCNTFSFVCPENIISKEDIPNGIGLIYLSYSQNNIVKFRWVKKPKVNNLDRKLYDTMIRLALIKCKFRKHDIF